MKVCDKCRKRKVEKNLRAGSKDYELCSECYNRVVRWLEEPEQKGLLDIFGGNR